LQPNVLIGRVTIEGRMITLLDLSNLLFRTGEAGPAN
jgi:hypothetical protein